MEYKKLLNYRYVWMAIAIVWIMIYHTGLRFENHLVDTIVQLGYSGSDVFFFASGAGLYLSLNRNSNPKEFYKKRFWKVLPKYWVILIVWIVVRMYVQGLTGLEIIGNIVGLEALFDVDKAFNWYFSFMLISYVLAPMLKKLTEKLNAIGMFILSLAIVGVGFLCVHNSNIIIGYSRLIIFLWGMYLGKSVADNKTVKKWQILVFALGVVVGYYLVNNASKDFMVSWSNGMLWYPLCLAIPGLCFGLSYIWETLHINWGIVRWIGQHTLELYLIHILIYDIYQRLIVATWQIEDNFYHWFFIWVFVAVFVLLFDCIWKKLEGKITG